MGKTIALETGERQMKRQTLVVWQNKMFGPPGIVSFFYEDFLCNKCDP